MTLLQSGITKSLAVAYDIDNSVRIEKGAGLSKTIAGDGNKTTWTWSGWTKNAFDWSSTADNVLFSAIHPSGASSGRFLGYFRGQLPDTYFEINQYQGSYSTQMATNAVYRDPGAWLHVVVVWDTDNGVTADNARIWINGERITSFRTENLPSDGEASSINEADCTQAVGFGTWDTAATGIASYLAEVYFIDGQALDADSFGELNATTNQWIPKDASGLTFGTNGFYQKYGATELADSFTDSAYEEYIVPVGITSLNVLVVAGGAGGGGLNGGGGGGGGVVNATSYSVTPGETISLSVGAGGDGGPVSVVTPGSNGSNSTFGTITAVGGGGGGAGDSGMAGNPHVGVDGGSGGGGGGSSESRAGGTGTQGASGGGTGYGNDGGTGKTTSKNTAAGGGGSDAVGGDGDANGGVGGAGDEFTTFGAYGTDSSNDATPASGKGYFSGGGGGGVHWYLLPTGGAGGVGGGGKGSGDRSSQGTGPIAGTAHTGGGGGGGWLGAANVAGAAGGSGTVIVYDGTTYTQYNIAHPITAVGDVANTRAERKIGDSSIFFDGTGDWLTTPDSSDWDFGADDFTCECWIRIPSLTAGGAEQTLMSTEADPNYSLGWVWMFGPGGTSNDYTTIGFLYSTNGSSWADSTHHTSGLVADTWTHVAVVRATTTVTIYVAGSSIGTHTIGTSTIYNPSEPLDIGSYGAGSADAFQGYMDEIRISDSARYTGTFTPSTTAFTADSNTKLLIHSNWDGGLGADSSGNYNTFTPTNLVATDQMVDTPTNNFATINPLYNNNFTYTEGNLDIAGPQGSTGGAYSTIAQDSGKWYFEMLYSGDTKWRAGIAPTESGADGASGNYGTIIEPNTYIYNFFTGATDQDISGTTISTDDLIGVAFNMDDNEVDFYVNNVQVGSTASLGTPTTPWGAYFMNYSTSGDANPTYRVNFGQDSSFAGTLTAQGNQDSNEVGDFYYAPPTDFLTLCSSNLPSPEIALPGDHFNTKLYDDGAGAKTGVGFQPDFVWVKSRGSTYEHELTDAVRGVTKAISSDSNNAETTDSTGLTAFGADGFTVGADTNYSDTTGTGMVAWNWKGDGVSGGTLNEVGSIDSQVNVSTTSGFSIVKYVGNGIAGATVGHGLGVQPGFIAIKSLDGADGWICSGPVLGLGASGYPNDMYLDGDAAKQDDQIMGADPSSTLFTIRTAAGVNGSSANYIAYCFASIEGYSQVGSYVPLSSSTDSSFVYTGFKPAYILSKSITNASSWYIFDAVRNTYNVVGNYLESNTTAAEGTLTAGFDFCSNGFKDRGFWGSSFSGETILFYAIAESPFKTSNAR